MTLGKFVNKYIQKSIIMMADKNMKISAQCSGFNLWTIIIKLCSQGKWILRYLHFKHAHKLCSLSLLRTLSL
jgi:hypothetical protein